MKVGRELQHERFVDLVNHVELVIFGTSLGGSTWSENFQRRESIEKGLAGLIDNVFTKKKLVFPTDGTNKKVSAKFKSYIVKRLLQKMLDDGGIEIRETLHAGNYFRIKNKEFKNVLAKLPSDSVAAQDLKEIGEQYLADALSNFSLSDFANMEKFDDAFEIKKADEIDEEKIEIPAANRIVSVNDNQFEQVDKVTDELLSLVTRENKIGDENGLRERVLGQINAGRELVRHGSVRAYLLYQTVVEVLRLLIKNYAGTAIAETAKTLLTVYLTNILGE